MRAAPHQLIRLDQSRCDLRRRVDEPVPLLRCRGLSTSGDRETLDEELQRLASYSQTSVSLKATLDTGLGLLLKEGEEQTDKSRRQRTLMQIASFLRRELPVRLARRVIELQGLPEGLHEMPSVNRVKHWYEQSFIEIRRSRPPDCVESELEFFEMLKKIYDRHGPTLVTMARGVYELKQASKHRARP